MRDVWECRYKNKINQNYVNFYENLYLKMIEYTLLLNKKYTKLSVFLGTRGLQANIVVFSEIVVPLLEVLWTRW